MSAGLLKSRSFFLFPSSDMRLSVLSEQICHFVYLQLCTLMIYYHNVSSFEGFTLSPDESSPSDLTSRVNNRLAAPKFKMDRILIETLVV